MSIYCSFPWSLGRLHWCHNLWYRQSYIPTARKRKWHFGGFHVFSSVCEHRNVSFLSTKKASLVSITSDITETTVWCPNSEHLISCPNISNLQLSINRKTLHITHSITLLSIHYPNWISSSSFSQKRSTALDEQWHQICRSFLDSYSMSTTTLNRLHNVMVIQF